MFVEAKSTLNYGMFDLRLYCPSTWVHTSNLVLLLQLAQLLLQVYFYREMIPPNEGMHVPDQLFIPCTYRAGLPHVAGPLLQQQYRDEHMLQHVHYIYIYTYIYIYISMNMSVYIYVHISIGIIYVCVCIYIYAN